MVSKWRSIGPPRSASTSSTIASNGSAGTSSCSSASQHAGDLSGQNVHPCTQELAQLDQDSAQLDRQIPVALGDARVARQPGPTKASKQRLVDHHVPPESLQEGTREEASDLAVPLRVDAGRGRAEVAGHKAKASTASPITADSYGPASRSASRTYSPAGIAGTNSPTVVSCHHSPSLSSDREVNR